MDTSKKGHMKKIRKTINSIKKQETPPNEDKQIEILKTRSNHVFSNIIDTQQQIATDLTGKFPVTYRRDNK